MKGILKRTLLLTYILVLGSTLQLCRAEVGKTGAAKAASEPTWKELATLYGHDTREFVVKDFIVRYKLWDLDDGYIQYLHPFNYAYAIMYKDHIINRVVLHINAMPETYDKRPWVPYAGSLPAGVLKSDTPTQAFKKLSEFPAAWSGGERCGGWVENYPVEFQYHKADEGSPLDVVNLFVQQS